MLPSSNSFYVLISSSVLFICNNFSLAQVETTQSKHEKIIGNDNECCKQKWHKEACEQLNSHFLAVYHDVTEHMVSILYTSSDDKLAIKTIEHNAWNRTNGIVKQVCEAPLKTVTHGVKSFCTEWSDIAATEEKFQDIDRWEKQEPFDDLEKLVGFLDSILNADSSSMKKDGC